MAEITPVEDTMMAAAAADTQPIDIFVILCWTIGCFDAFFPHLDRRQFILAEAFVVVGDQS